jgi:MtrB/PioB family decaheme-associated outer membrane protein
MRRLLTTVILVCLPAAALAQDAPADQAAAPQAAAQPAAPPAPAATETPRSLFDDTWKQFFIGGRGTNIDGDPARFQRYQDVRNGVLFSNLRYAYTPTTGDWIFQGKADNVGYYDQEYLAHYRRIGKFDLTGSFQGIPQFYSVDTKTPYTGIGGGTLILDDATQRAIQNGDPAKLNLYVPIANQFDLRERRDIGKIDFTAAASEHVDVHATFTTQKHSGELPYAAGFGFSNGVEVPLPYDSRTNDITIDTEWTNPQNMLRVGYNGSWFNNISPTLVWDSPLRLDDASGAPGHGQMALWPTNSAQTISFGGYHKMPHHTQVTGFFSYGDWTNNSALLPFTINSALPQIALPRATTEAQAHVFSTNLGIVSHPSQDWRFSAKFRNYDYNNEMPATSITQYVAYDSSVSTTPTGGPDLFAHSRTNFDADATWTHIKALALTAGYSRNNYGWDFRTFANSGENVLRLTADAVGTSWATFRVQYEYGSRTGSGLDQTQLTSIGEQPSLRYYDIADRTRNRFTGQVDIVPTDAWTFSVSGGTGKDDYSNTALGLQSSTFHTLSLAADYHVPNGLGAGATYNYENYGGLQRSRQSNDSATFNNPAQDWTLDATERVHYFSIYATPPRIGPKTEIRFSYDFSHAEGNYFYTIMPGSTITPPNQLPDVFNKLQQLHIDARHRLSDKLAATFSYLYEPFRVYDFSMDPSVINGIVQPSTLVLGYVYRPYTANSFVVGLRYYW